METSTVRILQATFAVVSDAFHRFNADDGWAIASHIALSALMSLFPFLIVVVALAGFLGTRELADEVANLFVETWPKEVSAPIAREIHTVLTSARGDVLTIGVMFAVFFSSSGVESLRVGLNRAYDATEHRHWLWLRLESIAYVLIGAVALIALAFLIVLFPLAFATARKFLPWIEPLERIFNVLRYGVATVVLAVALVVVHKWLPAGRRTIAEILPGVGTTLVLWLIAGEAFGRYLAAFAGAYVTYYAGLASVMIALVFLYITASIFVFGGELNAAIRAFGQTRARCNASPA
jgi:membrane protein